METTKPFLPAGTYWDHEAERYVEPTDPDWSDEKFAALLELARSSHDLDSSGEDDR